MTEGEVPDEEYLIPLGEAEIKRAGPTSPSSPGRTWSLKCLEAAERLAAEGISVEVVDLRTLVPMDVDCVLESVRRTGRLVIAQEAVQRGGVGERHRGHGRRARRSTPCAAPIVRVAGPEHRHPVQPGLERAAVPRSTTSWPASAR